MNGATILDPVEGERVKALSRRKPRGPALSEITLALLDGSVIHFPDERNHFNASQLRRSHSVILHTSLDDEGGRYWWAEPAPDSTD
jgi:hypothetical protein